MSKKQIETTVENDIMYQISRDSATGDLIAEAMYAVDKSLKEVIIPNSVENVPVVSIAEGAFAQMHSLKGIILDYHPYLTVKEKAFAFCPNLTAVCSYTDNLYLESKAFFEDSSLSNFMTHSNLSLTGECIFFKCPQLEMIRGLIGKIQNNALLGAIGLRKIYFDENIELSNSVFNQTALYEIWFKGNVKFINSATPEMLKNYRIVCSRYSNLASLIYEGYNMDIRSIVRNRDF